MGYFKWHCHTHQIASIFLCFFFLTFYFVFGWIIIEFPNILCCFFFSELSPDSRAAIATAAAAARSTHQHNKFNRSNETQMPNETKVKWKISNNLTSFLTRALYVVWLLYVYVYKKKKTYKNVIVSPFFAFCVFTFPFQTTITTHQLENNEDRKTEPKKNLCIFLYFFFRVWIAINLRFVWNVSTKYVC